ncbi:uncharacterized protein EHS24_006346 [Apiotrichum porosum]|uniref:F-box domain-containing protein n=1 Tax=Apiotrichum porosum TaxID=105984 RepID=A0A427Y117_9TREE|nr:uncharacterized protein EHS24_006346 [Apiotrichum porosum]RSH84818.1 hypothetical protein EHS24_006346 [Apiotrichum porosum]
MVTVTLDHTVFPHIIDRILTYASRPVLATCRMTCKGLHNAVAKVQAQHLILSPGDGKHCTYLSVTTPYGPLPGLNGVYCTPDVNKAISELKRYTVHTTVLTMEGFVSPDNDLTLLASAFPNLKMYRIAEERIGFNNNEVVYLNYTPYYPFQCHTLVILADTDTVPNPGAHIAWDPYHCSQCTPANVEPAIPPGVTKIVLNWWLDTMHVDHFVPWLQPNDNGFPCIGNVPPSIEDIVIIFQRYNTSVRPLHFTGDGTDFDRRVTRLNVTFTLVGVDDTCQATLHKALRHRLSDSFTEEKAKEDCIADILEHVKFLTMDEYAKGVQNIELETQVELDKTKKSHNKD